jgi:hypothetical protein
MPLRKLKILTIPQPNRSFIAHKLKENLLHKQNYKKAHRYQRFESNALILSNLLPTLEKLWKPICRG